MSVLQWFPRSNLHRRSQERRYIWPSPSVPDLLISRSSSGTRPHGGLGAPVSISDRHHAGGGDQTDFFPRRRRARALTGGRTPASSGSSGDRGRRRKAKAPVPLPQDRGCSAIHRCGRGSVFTHNTGPQIGERGMGSTDSSRLGRRSSRSVSRVANPPVAGHARIAISNAFIAAGCPGAAGFPVDPVFGGDVHHGHDTVGADRGRRKAYP